MPGVNAPAPRLETTKPRDVPAKAPVRKTNPLLPEVQLAKKAPAEKSEKTASKKATSSSKKASQSKKAPSKKAPKKKKSSDSSPLTPLVYLGLFYLAYAFVTDDE